MKIKYLKFYILGSLLVIAVLVWITVFTGQGSGLLEVNFFDIGQGDAIFIETPEKIQILVDGGPDAKILEKLGKEMPFYDRTLDLVILTHPDPDHLNGIIEVFKRYKIKKIVYTGVVPEDLKQKGVDIIEKSKAEKIIVKAGQRVDLGQTPLDSKHLTEQVYIDILYPFEDITGQKFSDFNQTSIVCRLVYGKISFLLTGDAPKSAEYQLLAKQVNLDSDILKVAHHGSKTSTTNYFLEAVSPAIAVIQVGRDNKFGHPHREVLDDLNQQNIKILRTDLLGDIKILSNGMRYKIENPE
ncbi:MAG: hydrolase [Parcubacteria group bacterium CG11_big_fil_rev_8_21_14_0_20_39_14]|nr:MAG: hydrolase [Parcubacteria group bacterium CG11_big_fil_rev_8_21_14_0_20_39_14]